MEWFISLRVGSSLSSCSVPAVAPASAPLLALGGCPTAHGSWASDPCWTERTVRALAQLEMKMASVIAIVIVIVVVTVTVITIVVVIIVVVTIVVVT